MKEFKVDLPEDLDFCPIMEITAYDVQFQEEQKLFGIGNLDLKSIFSEKYESVSAIEYELDEMLDVMCPSKAGNQDFLQYPQKAVNYIQLKKVDEDNMDIDF